MPERATDNSRRHHRLDPAARHDLDVIDRVLVGVQTETAADAELADLVLRLRTTRPTADEEVRERLDQRFSVRMAAERRTATARPLGVTARLRGAFTGISARRASLVGAGALATVLVGVVVVVSLPRDQGLAGAIEHRSLSDQSGVMSAKRAPSESDVVAPSQDMGLQPTGSQKSPRAFSAIPGSAGSGFSAGTDIRSRKQVRSANVVLATGSAQIERTADKVIATTDQFGGFVLSSSVSGGDAGRASAEFDLRLPAGRFQQALAAYSGLAHVRERTQQTQDVTDPYGRATARLSAARAESVRLRARLAAASDAEAPALRARLRAADRNTEARRAELSRLRNRVSFVTLGVSIVADESAMAADRGTLGGAVDTAKHLLTRIAAILIVTLALVIPLAVVMIVAVFGSRRLRRGSHDLLIADVATQPPAGPAPEQARG